MTTPLTYTIDQAAERIGPLVTVDWLKKHMSEIPHRKSGLGRGRAGRIGFTETDIAEIVQMLERRPEDKPAPAGPEQFQSIASRAPRRSA
jgi:hypothetical protein